MKQLPAMLLVVLGTHAATAGSAEGGPFVAPAEFEPQEYIWLSWIDRGWLGGKPASGVALDVMRAITPYVRVRLMYSALSAEDTLYRGPFRLSPDKAEA